MTSINEAVVLLQAAPRDGYQLHRIAHQAFANPGDETRRFVFAPIEIGGRSALYGRGELAGLPREMVKPFLAPEAGEELDFSLLAAPAYKWREGGSTVVREFAPLDGAGRLNWLAKRARRCGFKLLASEIAFSRRFVVRKPGLPVINFDSTGFIGRLMVEDPTAFAETLKAGIGRQRAWGHGTMLLHRP